MKTSLVILFHTVFFNFVLGQETVEYKFRYRVKDEVEGQDFGQEEERNGEDTGGEYQVLLPDGRTQVVRYQASEPAGFLATVEYQGEVNLPAEPLQYLRVPKRIRPKVESILLANRASLPRPTTAPRVISIPEKPLSQIKSIPKLPSTPVVGNPAKPLIPIIRIPKKQGIIKSFSQQPSVKEEEQTPLIESIIKIEPPTSKLIRKEKVQVDAPRIIESPTNISENDDSPIFTTNTESPKMEYKDSDFKASSSQVLNSLFREDIRKKEKSSKNKSRIESAERL